ncbi:hypothetical protein ABNF42_14370 [Paenibacillus larvae]
MVESQQHQMYIQRAVDEADQAILAAQKAEHDLQTAVIKADPVLIQKAQAELGTAKRRITESYQQLNSFDPEKYGQQLKQTIGQTRQAIQDLNMSEEVHTPKQVR